MKDKSRKIKLRIWKKANRLIKTIYNESIYSNGDLSGEDHFALFDFDDKIHQAMKELNDKWRIPKPQAAFGKERNVKSGKPPPPEPPPARKTRLGI